MPKSTTPSDVPLTKNQAAVYAVLEDASKPLGAYDILEAVREVGLKGPPQVYRALDKLVSLGLVHRIESLNAFLACHHGPHEEPAAFIICRHCELTVELPVSRIETFLVSDALPEGFSVDEVKVEIKGRCRDCTPACAQ